MTKTIDITTRKELDIYMNPQRQRILKCLSVNSQPMTPKQLSNELGISASAVTFHLKKLESIGVVELDYTEMIRGIQAKYYKRTPAVVNLRGSVQDDLKEEKTVLLDYLMNDIWNGFKEYLSGLKDMPKEDEVHGDASNGILYLTKEEAKQAMDLILSFQKNHQEPREGTEPWEYAVIAYPKNRSEEEGDS